MIESLASWHPFIVHFAIAFGIGSAVFDVLDFFTNKKILEQTGYILMITAFPFLLLAVLTGNLAEGFIRETSVTSTLDNHIVYANIAVWVFFAAGAWRVFLHLKRRYAGGKKIIYVFVITFAAVSIFLAALHGGRIRQSESLRNAASTCVILPVREHRLHEFGR